MKAFYLIILVFSSVGTLSQNKTIDSLQKVLQTQKEDTAKVNNLNALSFQFRYSKPDTSNNLANAALSLATKLNYEMGIADSKVRLGMQSALSGKYDEGVKFGDEAIIIYKKLVSVAYKKDKEKILKKIGSAYNVIGHNRISQGNYPEGLKNSFLALKVREQLGDKKGISDTEYNIGNIYASQHNYTEALKHYSASLKLSEQLGNKTNIATSLSAIGFIYFEQGNYQDALKNYSTALKLAEETKDEFNLGQIYICLGLINDKQGNYTQALKYYFAALKIYQDARISEQIAWIYNGIGSAYMKQKKYNDASKYLNKALSFAKLINNLENIKLSYENWTKLDSAQGNYKQALGHYKSFVQYRDSLVNDENTKKIVQTQMQYDFDKKESLTKVAQEKKDAETNRIRNVQYFTIAILAVIILAALFIARIQYRNNTQRKKDNLLLIQQKQKVEITLTELKSAQSQLIQSEKMASLGELTAGIAHEIQNPLNFINNFSDVNKELLLEMNEEIAKMNFDGVIAIAGDVIDNEEKINHHGKRADAIVKGMLQHSRSSSGQKTPTDINKLADEYLRLAYHGLRAKDKLFNATMKADFDEAIGKISINPQDIGRSILNLITNAFYAVTEKKKGHPQNYEPAVLISTKKIGNNIQLSIKDNGNGISQKVLDKIFQPFFTTKPTGQGTGLGLSLAYDIIKAHGGELKVETKEGEGSTFIIYLPVV